MLAKEQTNEMTCLLYAFLQARRVTENDFDILVARFYILKANKIIEPHKIPSALSLECYTLHSFVRKLPILSTHHLTAAILKDAENRSIIFGLRHDNANTIYI
jgi:hypothetical protein